MVKGLVFRFLPLSLAAFALGGAVAVVTTDHGSSALGSLDETSNVPLPAYAGDLPDVALETSDGMRTSFAATNGHIRIATMFYSHCPGVCPMTLETLRGIEGQLTEEQRSKLNFVLLSLDPARDTPAQMRAMAAERGIQSARWLFGRTSPAGLASFAKAAHISYRPLSDGSIDHSSSLVLLNERGEVVARSGDGGTSAEFVNAVRQAVNSAGVR